MAFREAPAPEPLHCGLADPSHPDASNEPVLNIDEIQGNILGGFNKDFQTILALTIDDVDAFKHWLKKQVPHIATAAEVIAFNRLFKAIRTRRGEPTNVKATWVNVAFSFEGLLKLAEDAEEFDDEEHPAFAQGMATRAACLGDPVDDDGDPVNWVVGGPQNDPADVIFLVASDIQQDMEDEVHRILHKLEDHGAHLAFQELGQNLSGGLHGHEHFGFLDGVSQPGIRGRLSDDPHDVLTPRQNPNNRDQGKPGQDLLWPGEFVFGYPGQKRKEGDEDVEVADPGAVSFASPEWAVNGSFLVFRRLRQDVFNFHRFLQFIAQELAGQFNIPNPTNASAADRVGSQLVGRWKSGAPIEREPDNNNENLAGDDCANNNFEFQEEADPVPPSGVPNPFDCVDVDFPVAPEDADGARCPFSGHIRKAYPRDDEPLPDPEDGEGDNPEGDNPEDANGYCINCDEAREELGEENTQTHRLLRRGIPFGGDASASTPDNPVDDDPENGRGLHFFAYQTSIEEQFEFVNTCWVNNPDFKEPKGPEPGDPLELIDPIEQGGGHDPIIGQNSTPGEGRIREFTVTIPDPDNEGERKAVRISTAAFVEETGVTDWVIPTGGGYFFAPSISALKKLAKPNP